MTKENQSAGEQGIAITHIFDAPRELVWKYWTDPGYFMRWWGPEDFITPVSRIDFRVGALISTACGLPKVKITGVQVYIEKLLNRRGLSIPIRFQMLKVTPFLLRTTK
jgi:Activator of Hsp90 ATPase homolog 1-like protein